MRLSEDQRDTARIRRQRGAPTGPAVVRGEQRNGTRQFNLPDLQARVYDLLGTHPRALSRISFLLGSRSGGAHFALKRLEERGLVQRAPMVSGGMGWRRA